MTGLQLQTSVKIGEKGLNGQSSDLSSYSFGVYSVPPLKINSSTEKKCFQPLITLKNLIITFKGTPYPIFNQRVIIPSTSIAITLSIATQVTKKLILRC